MNFKKVISVCSKKDLHVWKFASREILKSIESDTYEVIVPDAEVELFSKISPNQYIVTPESIYAGGLRNLILKKMPSSNISKLGWYLQQFIKINASRANNEDDYILIWDADTVPVRKLSFFNKSSKLIYYKGDENHEPYFDFIKKILGLEKLVNFSFIAQCFPLKVEWLNSFCNHISSDAESWESRMLSEINFSEKSGFSEYETMGTYFYHVYQSEMIFSSRLWLRLGNSEIGSVDNFEKKWAKKLLQKYDFVSFEVWDRVSRKDKFKFFLKNLKECLS